MINLINRNRSIQTPYQKDAISCLHYDIKNVQLIVLKRDLPTSIANHDDKRAP